MLYDSFVIVHLRPVIKKQKKNLTFAQEWLIVLLNKDIIILRLETINSGTKNRNVLLYLQ